MKRHPIFPELMIYLDKLGGVKTMFSKVLFSLWPYPPFNKNE
jgi:hypothetical protein